MIEPKPRVRDCMREALLVLAPDAALADAAAFMDEGGHRHAIVAERGQLRGILSSRDLLAGFSRQRLAYEGRVAGVMTPAPLVTVTPCTLVEEAAELMVERRVMALPVTSGGHPVGLVTSADLLGWLPRVLTGDGDEADPADATTSSRARGAHGAPGTTATARGLPSSLAGGESMTTTRTRETVREWMSEALVTVQPDEPLFAAAEQMAERGIRHVLVVDRGGLRGILSNRDLVRATLHGSGLRLDLHAVSVGQVMTPTPLVTVVPSASVEEAAQTMVEHGVNALPVTSGGHPVGIVTSDDLLRSLARRRQSGRFFRPGL